MKVQFLQNRTVEAAGGESFIKDQIYDLPEPSARRWIGRGVAKAVAGAEPEPAAESAPPPASETPAAEPTAPAPPASRKRRK